MGLFSSKKKTYVASSVYNLAGPIEDRPNILKTSLMQSVIDPNVKSIAENAISNTLAGPGVKLRQFSSWVTKNNLAGMLGQQSSSIYSNQEVDNDILIQNIPKLPDETIVINTSELGEPDWDYWADRYVSTNYPDRYYTDWEADFNEGTNTITIMWEDTSISTFLATGFNRNSRYIYANYITGLTDVEENLTVGMTVTLYPYQEFPSVSGWTQTANQIETKTETLQRTVTLVTTYTDGREGETTTEEQPEDVTFEEFHRKYEQVTYIGEHPAYPGKLVSIQKYRDYVQEGVITQETTSVVISETLVPGPKPVLKRITRNITRDVFTLVRKFREDHRNLVHHSLSTPKIFIYAQGSGIPALDAMFEPKKDIGQIYPILPIRVNNKMWTKDQGPVLYSKVDEAMKRTIDVSHAELSAKVKDNPNLKDIDYAYTVYGVTLNTKDDSAKKYLYNFFNMLREAHTIGSGYADWMTRWNTADASWTAYQEWWDRINVFGGDPDEPAPEVLAYPSPSGKSFSVYNTRFGYNILMLYTEITESFGSGLMTPTAKLNDIVVEYLGNQTYYRKVKSATGIATDTSNPVVMGATRIRWQYSADQWKSVVIWGLTHRNIIYRGKYVEISAAAALSDSSESGFIVPLHAEVFKRLSLKDANQASTACTYLVFNSYQVVKQPWYSRGAFKIVMLIAMIVISVFNPPAGVAGYGALTATYIATTYGVSLAIATLINGIVNAVMGIIISQILSQVTTKVFGEEFGALVAMVVSYYISNGGSFGAPGGGEWTAAFQKLMSPDNFMKLADAISGQYAKYTQQSTLEITQETQYLYQQYNEQMNAIQSAYDMNIGTGLNLYNPMVLTEALQTQQWESPQSFTSRTLMTGLDVANGILRMIDDFSGMTVHTRLP